MREDKNYKRLTGLYGRMETAGTWRYIINNCTGVNPMINDIKGIVKNEVEKLLFRHGFSPVTIKLAQKTNDGTEEINCYKNNGLYSMITILHGPTMSNEMKNWVLIEYADSLYDVKRWGFEDGGMIPLDIPLEQIISELEDELTKAISGKE